MPKHLARALLSIAFVLPLLVAACGEEGEGDTDSGTATDSGTLPTDSAPPSDGGPNPMVPDGALPPPPDCSPVFGGPRDGSSDGAMPLLLIGIRDETGFHPWEEGATVPFMWGFQGGTMVMPVVRVEGSSFEGDPLCVHAEILNEFIDEGTPVDVAEFRMDIEMYVRDGAYETDPVFDQISNESPAGRALSLQATISLYGESATGAVNVLVGPEDDGPLPGG
ncbi:MAG: hypothetical protein DRJ42_16790 [Deltaproteobacteria bacterium]|nr:MAG: hypothetical protein DRJ42_16790 [Deltaproteobacteria bacterium]